jgi:hypothetical protein
VCYETAQKVAEAWAALKEAFIENEIIGVPSAEGYIELKVVSEEDSTMPEDGPVLRVIEFTTMPDGQNAVKFEVIRA